MSGGEAPADVRAEASGGTAAPAAAPSPGADRPVAAALAALVRHRRLASTWFALTLGLTVVVILLTPRRYTASTVVRVTTPSPTAVATEAVALRSRDLAERVIRERGLASDPAFHDAQSREGQLREVGLRDVGLRDVGLREVGLLDRYASYLAVRTTPETDTIEVRFTTPSPALSVVLAVAHVEAYQKARSATDDVAAAAPIAPPPLPTWPSRPDIPLHLALGVAAATIVAAGATFARELSEAGVEADPRFDLLGLPTLAAIPDFGETRRDRRSARVRIVRRADDGAEPASDLVVGDPRAAGPAEAFRRLRTTPPFSGPPPRVVLVTSAGPAEGKTVASVNLAAALAEGGARVLLVDANLRRPRCHAVLGVSNGRGLATYLAGQADLRTLVHHLGVPGVSLLPAGPPPENPSSLVGSGHMRALLTRLRGDYDCLVLDAPPVLPCSDAVMIARAVDAVVLVAARGTSATAVARARDRLGAVGVPIVGLILNRVAGA